MAYVIWQQPSHFADELRSPSCGMEKNSNHSSDRGENTLLGAITAAAAAQDVSLSEA